MGFVYFLPTSKPLPSADELRAAGLGYLVGAGLPAYRGTRGPGDAEGVVFAGDGGSALYKPAAQTWRKGPKGAYWVGLALDEPRPGPASWRGRGRLPASACGCATAASG
jgi:hypothetical protein